MAALSSATTPRNVYDQARSIVGTGGPGTTIIASDGGENTPDNIDVAASLKDGDMSMFIAQVDILCSNSMIERFWSSMKHSFFFTLSCRVAPPRSQLDRERRPPC